MSVERIVATVAMQENCNVWVLVGMAYHTGIHPDDATEGVLRALARARDHRKYLAVGISTPWQRIGNEAEGML